MGLYQVLRKEYKKPKSLWLLRLFATMYLDPSKNAVVYYRIAKYFYDSNHKLISKFFERKLIHSYACYISMKAEIGEDFKMIHANGVVIGDGVIIGNNVRVYQQVSLGGRKSGDQAKNNYPTIENDVTVFSGAKLIGKINIGESAVIGANTVVLKDVKARNVVAGVPAKVLNEIKEV